MGRNLWRFVFVAVMLVIKVDSSLHRVGGGKYTWNSDVNYSDWATNQRIYSGDWLYFGFDRTRHNVLQVNQTSYEKCIETDYIFNVTRGGRDVIQLVEPKPYYFICGRGYCLKGMKLAVNVLPQPPPSTPQVPINTTALTVSTATSLIIKHSNAFTIILAFLLKAIFLL